MTRYQETRRSLDKHQLAPKKRFGQNFLVNRRTAQAIVLAGRVAPTDTIVEVGVGLGALTQPLAERAARVIGLEIDSGIIRFHEEEKDLPGNVTLLHQDILQADFKQLASQCGARLKIMANLPYSISNPFIFKLIDNRELVECATIMLQKEVANRLMAHPATKEYGVPSVLLQSCATTQKLMTLSPREFHPRPKIDSVVVRIVFDRQPPQAHEGMPFDFPLFQRLVRTTFNQRRKTILNSLSAANLLPADFSDDKTRIKPLLEEVIRQADLDPALRPEVLSLEDFHRLTFSMKKKLAALSPAPSADKEANGEG